MKTGQLLVVVVAVFAAFTAVAEALIFPVSFVQDDMEIYLNYYQGSTLPERGVAYARIDSAVHRIDQARTRVEPMDSGNLADVLVSIEIGGSWGGPISQSSGGSGRSRLLGEMRVFESSGLGGYSTLNPPTQFNYGDGSVGLLPATVEFRSWNYWQDNDRWGWQFNFAGHLIPEPATLVLLGFGSLALGLPALRRRCHWR